MAISVDKVSGNYSVPLQVTVTVTPDQYVDYVAIRLRKEFQAGYIVESADEKLSGTIANNQSLTLPSSGAWELTLSAAGADDVVASYGVGVELPAVTIETDNTTPFQRSLDVKAKTTRGKLYHSPDGQGWLESCTFHLTRTCTVHFVALDEQGIASAIVEKAYNKKIPWDDCVTATLSEHFITKRLDLQQFLDLGNTLGFNATVTLYRIEGKWVPTPEPEARIEERLKDLEAENARLRLEIANLRLDKTSRAS